MGNELSKLSKHILRSFLLRFLLLIPQRVLSVVFSDLLKHNGSRLADQYARDNLWVDRISLHWMEETQFVDSYAEATLSHSVALRPRYEWRLHVLGGLARYAALTFPDSVFVDLGVHEAVYARFIRSYFSGCPVEKHYLFDSWVGLSERASTTELIEQGTTYVPRGAYERVIESFGSDPSYVIIKGFLPETLVESDLLSKRIGFLSVDLNSAADEVASISAVWLNLVPGGVVVLDDYGRNPLQRSALDRLFLSLNQKVISLPTGQGIVIKVVS